MRKSKFTDDQKLAILAEHDSGVGVSELSRKHQISPATFYKWKKEHEENQDEDKRRIKELEAENKRLKKMYANLSMDHDILKEGYAMAKKYAAKTPRRSPRPSLRQQCGTEYTSVVSRLGFPPSDVL